VDAGEGLRAAALRETLEEAGVVVELKGVLQVSWGHRYEWRRVIFYAEPVGDAGPHVQGSRPGAVTAAGEGGGGGGGAPAVAAVAAGGGSSSSRAEPEKAGSTAAAAAAAAAGGVAGGSLVCPGRVVPHHMAPTLPQAIQLAQQQLQQLEEDTGNAGEDDMPSSRPAVVPKTLPDFESAGACWVRLEQLGQLKLRSAEVPLTWFPHVAGGGAMDPLVQPQGWQKHFPGWEW
jgi:ADP-ribose pyrophosphatase YjhB (NUDIX family)